MAWNTPGSSSGGSGNNGNRNNNWKPRNRQGGGIGDVIDNSGSTLSWFSPIAWAQQMRAFVALRWWPLALLALVLAPVVWLLALPFRLAGACVTGMLALVKGIFLLPARLLGART